MIDRAKNGIGGVWTRDISISSRPPYPLCHGSYVCWPKLTNWYTRIVTPFGEFQLVVWKKQLHIVVNRFSIFFSSLHNTDLHKYDILGTWRLDLVKLRCQVGSQGLSLHDLDVVRTAITTSCADWLKKSRTDCFKRISNQLNSTPKNRTLFYLVFKW